MLPLFFLYIALLPLIFTQSLPHTTITPDVDQILQGSWTVSVALPASSTLEVDIETEFDEINAVTLVGPTTLVTVIRIRSAISTGLIVGTGAYSLSSATSNATSDIESGASQAASPSPTVSSLLARSSSATASSKSLTITQDQGPYGEDPDSVMADGMDKEYANVTYTPPAYVPVKIPTDVCVLWDPSCKGNRTLAADIFFGGGKPNASGGTMNELFMDPCFDEIDSVAMGTNCTSSLLDPADASLSTAAKLYMRQSQCSEDYSSVIGGTSRAWEDCCGACWIYGPNVDVYYWPEQIIDTSCLDVIGSSVVPPDQGAQTDAAGIVYWAATTDLYDIYVPTVTTALITTINGIVVKEALANPWDAVPSITTTRPVPARSNKKRSPLSLHPRAYNPLHVSIPFGSNSSVPMGVETDDRISVVTGSIAVSNGFTFTSPSVYVAFYSLSATDMCGFRGKTFTSTMLSFAPGELSTVQGHLWGGGAQVKSTKVFNFADLPCPPKSVMYDDWYKPAPGEPYRPLIALPDKVRDLDPLWTACTEAFYFTGLDPARTLVAETEMVKPTVAAIHPSITPDPAQPVPALPSDTGAGATKPTQAAGDKKLAPPSDNEGTATPSTTDDLHSFPTTKGVDPQDGAHSTRSVPPPIKSPIAGPPAANSPIVKPSADISLAVNPPQIANPAVGPIDPGQSGATSQPFNPNDASLAQLSQIHHALQPSAQPQIPAAANPGPAGIVPSSANNEQKAPIENPAPAAPTSVPPSQDSASALAESGNGNSNDPQNAPAVAPADASSDASNPAPFAAVNVVIGGSTIRTPQATAQPAPAVAGKPIPNIGGGNFQIDSQTLSPGGATANIDGIPVHVNAQGAPVIGTQTYQTSVNDATTTIGTHVIVANTAGITVNGQQIQPGDHPVNIGGTPVQIQGPAADQNLEPGSQTSSGGNAGPGSSPGFGNNAATGENDDHALRLPQASSSPITTVAGVPVANNQGTYHIQGTPLAPGSAIAISGTTWSLASQGASGESSLNVGGKAYNLPKIGPSPVATFAGQQVQVVGVSAVAINGQTIHQGSPPITVSSVPVVFGQSNLVIGTSTIPIESQNQTPPSPILDVAGGSPLTQVAQNPNAYMIAGSTIAPGSSAAVVNGTTYSVEPSGYLLVGASTIPLATAGASVDGNGALSAGNKVFTPMEGGTAVVVGGSILSVNGPAATNHGTVISLATGGFVVGPSTYAFATPAANAFATTQEVPITTALNVAGQSLTANPSAFLVDGTTITAGGLGVTISGTPVSLDTGGNLIVGTSRLPLESSDTEAARTSARTFKGSAVQANAPFRALLTGMLGCITWQLL